MASINSNSHNSSGNDRGTNGGLTSLKASTISCHASSTSSTSIESRHSFSESLSPQILPIKQGISHDVDQKANFNFELSQYQSEKNLRSVTQESHEHTLSPILPMTISNPSHQQQHLPHSMLQTSGSKMELDGSSLMTSVINTNLESLAICNEKISPEPVSKEEKNEFLIFTRVLMRYLERKDPVMHGRAKLVIQECAEKGKKKEKGYESVTTALKKRLRETVGERYWARAEVYLKHFERKFRDKKPAT